MRRRVAITGAAGQLGQQLVRAFSDARHEVLALSRANFDITDDASLDRLTAWAPDLVVHSAAWTDVDGCARDPERAMRVNGRAAGAVARAAADAGAFIVHISTNEVFDGTLDRPYCEDDPPNPINPYGASKLEGERAVAAANRKHVIVRTAWLFGPRGTNFVTKIMAAARTAGEAGQPLRVVADEFGNPTWTPDLADVIVEICDGRTAATIVHVAGVPPVSRLAWAKVVLEAGAIAVDIEPVSLEAFERASTPPRRAVLRPSVGIRTLDWRPPTAEYTSALAAAESL